MKTETGKNPEKAADFLKNDQLVAIPTETVYGLAGNAFSETALEKIFKVKKRPKSDPLILHTKSISQIKQWSEDFPAHAEKLLEHFSPGPLTVILPKKPVISDIISAGYPTAAFRIPDHSMTLKLLEYLDFPLAAPSANPFGYISPTSPGHVEAQLGGSIPYILDGGTCRVGIESTIVSFKNDSVVIEREGGVSREQLEKVAGTGKVQHKSPRSNTSAPGNMKSHYSPLKKFVAGDLMKLAKEFSNVKPGVIAFQEIPEALSGHPGYQLTRNGDVNEAASNLFLAMHELDSNESVEIIFAEWAPDTGIGRAINDRLKKAAGRG